MGADIEFRAVQTVPGSGPGASPITFYDAVDTVTIGIDEGYEGDVVGEVSGPYQTRLPWEATYLAELEYRHAHYVTKCFATEAEAREYVTSNVPLEKLREEPLMA